MIAHDTDQGGVALPMQRHGIAAERAVRNLHSGPPQCTLSVATGTTTGLSNRRLTSRLSLRCLALLLTTGLENRASKRCTGATLPQALAGLVEDSFRCCHL